MRAACLSVERIHQEIERTGYSPALVPELQKIIREKDELIKQMQKDYEQQLKQLKGGDSAGSSAAKDVTAPAGEAAGTTSAAPHNESSVELELAEARASLQKSKESHQQARAGSSNAMHAAHFILA